MGPATRWLLNPETTAGAVQSLDNYDISGDGVKDLIVGRHDGGIETFQTKDMSMANTTCPVALNPMPAQNLDKSLPVLSR